MYAAHVNQLLEILFFLKDSIHISSHFDYELMYIFFNYQVSQELSENLVRVK